MPNVNDNLAKSLEEIEARADEVLSKSVEQDEADDKEDVEKALKPDEVASDTDKAGSEDKDNDGDDDKKEDKKDDDKGEDKDEDTKKSLTDEFLEDETIAKSVEVSDFLSQFTRINGDILDTLRSDINKSLETSSHTATILAKSFNAIMKSQEGLTNLVKSQASALEGQGELIKSLQDRLEGVEKQPAVRKSVINTMEKSFDHSAGLASAGEKQELSKSEKVEKLTNMAMNGENGVTVNDVVSFESTGQVRPELNQYLTN